MRRGARGWLLACGIFGIVNVVLTFKMLTLFLDVRGKVGQKDAQLEEASRLNSSVRECRSAIQDLAEETRAMDERLDAERRRADTEGGNGVFDRCSLRLADAEAEVKYMQAHAKRLRLQVLEKQAQEARKPTLRQALLSLTRQGDGIMDTNELRNALIVALADIAVTAVEKLQVLSNDELVSVARPHFKFQIDPKYV
mmetsp:Transcript_30034/g.78791  ORF Transcript_30034/g.78791 Transcript_30034/m.78791 type:complete len:197 (-) Transcript_30034:1731-2321(-)|eukprot:CAMPEP_0206289298 /NCGR_PEP_ID=MMETSP0106_2-20121207/2046_1 /ASSEMBLY_ACC=CAM_ASM_000206 /TAXON_ID=81532 /ORGANISM="Acanthoeca-like sp., Strain 10tr" /LENGTH=196 /DNA_ID=CAMNT_0053719851 /DNA_START=90 /DNA_END=680 /DNA_ORIENTATION=+